MKDKLSSSNINTSKAKHSNKKTSTYHDSRLYHDQIAGEDWIPALYFDEDTNIIPSDHSYDYFDDTNSF